MGVFLSAMASSCTSLDGGGLIPLKRGGHAAPTELVEMDARYAGAGHAVSHAEDDVKLAEDKKMLNYCKIRYKSRNM